MARLGDHRTGYSDSIFQGAPTRHATASMTLSSPPTNSIPDLEQHVTGLAPRASRGTSSVGINQGVATTTGMQGVVGSMISLSHSELGCVATKFRWARSSSVASLTRFRCPFFGRGGPTRPRSTMIRRMKFVFTTARAKSFETLLFQSSGPATSFSDWLIHATLGSAGGAETLRRNRSGCAVQAPSRTARLNARMCLTRPWCRSAGAFCMNLIWE